MNHISTISGFPRLVPGAVKSSELLWLSQGFSGKKIEGGEREWICRELLLKGRHGCQRVEYDRNGHCGELGGILSQLVGLVLPWVEQGGERPCGASVFGARWGLSWVLGSSGITGREGESHPWEGEAQSCAVPALWCCGNAWDLDSSLAALCLAGCWEGVGLGLGAS